MEGMLVATAAPRVFILTAFGPRELNCLTERPRIAVLAHIA